MSYYNLPWGDIRAVIYRDNILYFLLSLCSNLFDLLLVLPEWPFGMSPRGATWFNASMLLLSSLQKYVWTPRIVLQTRDHYDRFCVNVDGQYQERGATINDETGVGTMVFAAAAPATSIP
ncbi:hypothetical protein CONPUDRAFT_156496 [Coniophora puteana RWD-64-598 SS2]|uniref:Uncharacterized protein n=1 Tax=Coniophora puteana (strain RWD-64-598) TaxID=741705 RepID=A0A5M3MIA3_CONPW|nr:uncharacterized protein CONPUDRAFT_156496 [Coniophora puteana RWD-64-598 SS2]EIW78514.1 hypothetical protein CONPUDRAFT_156496 [Coniophora puteana RWD-64-598 SS2]